MDGVDVAHSRTSCAFFDSTADDDDGIVVVVVVVVVDVVSWLLFFFCPLGIARGRYLEVVAAGRLEGISRNR